MNAERKVELAYFVLGLLYAIFEAWLGRTPRFKAGSVLELVWNTAHGAYELVTGRTTKETPSVITQLPVNVSKPTLDLIQFFQRLAVDAMQHKDAAALQADLLGGIALLSELKDIPTDIAADPATFRRTLVLGGESFLEALVAARGQAGAATPGK